MKIYELNGKTVLRLCDACAGHYPGILWMVTLVPVGNFEVCECCEEAHKHAED